jgi:hypothetical protein
MKVNIASSMRGRLYYANVIDAIFTLGRNDGVQLGVTGIRFWSFATL